MSQEASYTVLYLDADAPTRNYSFAIRDFIRPGPNGTWFCVALAPTPSAVPGQPKVVVLGGSVGVRSIASVPNPSNVLNPPRDGDGAPLPACEIVLADGNVITLVLADPVTMADALLIAQMTDPCCPIL